MKILYAIQGTGNGHLSRARDIIPILQEKGELDILISGQQADLELSHPVKYRFGGLSFIFGKSGGVDVLATFRKNHLKKLWDEIQSLPVEDYDVVISDFEPVSSWACYLKGKPCVGLSHQAAVLNKHAPRPDKKDSVGAAILKYYAPATVHYGFHFERYDSNIFTPVIREEIRSLQIADKNHYTVYLPAYSDKRIIRMLSMFPDVQWEVFSKHSKEAFTEKNISLQPVTNDAFIHSMADATGVLCGAGFETPAETLYLQKKLLVIPMKGQYEQQCNAAALQKLGVPVIKKLKLKHAEALGQWLFSENAVRVDYPVETAAILDLVLKNYPTAVRERGREVEISSAKRFKHYLLSKILARLSG